VIARVNSPLELLPLRGLCKESEIFDRITGCAGLQDKQGRRAAHPVLSIPLSCRNSFFSVNDPNVVIQAVKPADSGEGYIIRLHEIAGKAAQATLASPFFQGARAQMADLMEQPGSELPVSGEQLTVPVPPNAVLTVLFHPASAVAKIR
jgi:hypothetical protein